jgi:hypothetical protein
MYNIVNTFINNPNFTSMEGIFASVNSITGTAICGNNVKNFSKAYQQAYNITSAVCGPNVIDMSYTYDRCSNLTGTPVCGNNVINMTYCYNNCYRLKGNPVCGNNVVNMASAYRYCNNITGNPVCGNNVIDMSYCYYKSYNITGNAVCGPNVTNMSYAYRECNHITSAACGNNVKDMSHAYEYCRNIISPACGPNVVNMAYAYAECNKVTSTICGPNVTNMANAFTNCPNITTAPVCGSKVKDMHSAYFGCYNMKGSPVCGPSVTTFTNVYQYCYNLTGAPVCGDKVTNLAFTYRDCYNLSGPPVCPDKITDMYFAYSYCHNMKGSPVCGNNVVNMAYAYNCCERLTGQAVIGQRVNNSYYAYGNCTNLTSAVIYTTNRISNRTFYGCSNMTLIDCSSYTNTLPTLETGAFDGLPGNCMVKLNTLVYMNISTYSGWSSYSSMLVPDITEKAILDKNDSDIVCKFPIGGSKEFALDFTALNFGADIDSLTHTISMSTQNVVTFVNLEKAPVGSIANNLKFNFKTAGVGTTTITLKLTSGSFTKTFTHNITTMEQTEEIIVSAVSGASYGFELNGNGYYESKNKGVGNSAALCKVEIINPLNKEVIFDCINYGESSYDYGLLSNVGQTLGTSFSDDGATGSTKVKRNFKGSQSSSIQSVSYGAVQGTVYVKYLKDSSVNNGYDTLQFKVRFGAAVEPEKPYEFPSEVTFTNKANGASYGFTGPDSQGYYTSNNAGKDSSVAIGCFTISGNTSKNVYIDYIIDSESGYDECVIGALNQVLSTNLSVDSGYKVSNSGSYTATVSYGVVNGTIYFKYYKDSSQYEGSDTLKVRIRLE